VLSIVEKNPKSLFVITFLIKLIVFYILRMIKWIFILVLSNKKYIASNFNLVNTTKKQRTSGHVPCQQECVTSLIFN